jgi:hypothetical protein
VCVPVVANVCVPVVVRARGVHSRGRAVRTALSRVYPVRRLCSRGAWVLRGSLGPAGVSEVCAALDARCPPELQVRSPLSTTWGEGVV